MEGFATFYMSGYNSSPLPIRGCVKVTPEHHVSVRSMFVGLDFQLPKQFPESTDLSFKTRGPKGDRLTITIRHINDLDCFYGEGTTDDEKMVVKFSFYKSDSIVSKLPHLVTWDKDWIIRK